MLTSEYSLVDSVFQVLLQPPDLWVYTHLFVVLQFGTDEKKKKTRVQSEANRWKVKSHCILTHVINENELTPHRHFDTCGKCFHSRVLRLIMTNDPRLFMSSSCIYWYFVSLVLALISGASSLDLIKVQQKFEYSKATGGKHSTYGNRLSSNSTTVVIYRKDQMSPCWRSGLLWCLCPVC